MGNFFSVVFPLSFYIADWVTMVVFADFSASQVAVILTFPAVRSLRRIAIAKPS